MEPINGQMVANTLASGKMANNMARAGSRPPQGLNDKGTGRMDKELAGRITNDFMNYLWFEY
jgi:hypothetical protein